MRKNTKNPLISIIIPVYNVEKYLQKCVASVAEQTYKNLEIILVDDGSPDGCPAMCDEFAKKDKRIKVIHKPNGGLSDARNVGLGVSTGEYFAFVDSDDYVSEKYIERLYYNMVQFDADVSICSFEKVFEDGTNEKLDEVLDNQVYVFEGKQKFEQLFSPNRLEMIVAWNKLYKKEIYENLKFPVGIINEDEWAVLDVLKNAKKVVYQANKDYFYMQRAGSIMNSRMSVKNLVVYGAIEKRIEYLKNDYEDLALKTLSYLFNKIYYQWLDYKNLRFEIQNEMNLVLNKYKADLKKLSYKDKIKMFLFKYFKWLISLRYKLKKKKGN